MDFINFLSNINFTNDEIELITCITNDIDYKKYDSMMDELITTSNKQEVLQKINSHMSRADKYDTLALFLNKAFLVHKEFVKQNISDEIYFDTMKCFKRFIDETQVINSSPLFDRDWWCYRQLSMILFRINQLEFELVDYNTINIHIPSDSILTKEEIELSISKAKDFISINFDLYTNAIYYCRSWLLSPDLVNMLNVNSKILLFQSYFTITETILDESSYFRWVFKQEQTGFCNLNENTTLQKSFKQFLLNGNKFYQGKGYLK